MIMFRYRRYRAFVVFALVTVLVLYHFSSPDGSWKDTASNAADFISHPYGKPKDHANPWPTLTKEYESLDLIKPGTSLKAVQTPPPARPTRLQPSIGLSHVTDPPSIPTPNLPHGRPQPHGAISGSSSDKFIRWKKLSEHFPVPTESLITLPSGKTKPIPKIQFTFTPETDAAKAGRLAKLETIRNVFLRSWKGYREHAWLHDELLPVAGSSRDPFAGWGATLVDALDTLWIMGLKTEFEEAAEAVDYIDFTTTARADIPVFETTIRYLGGLVAAYDVSGKKYQNLLNKAEELAEILISAFDTPNRMPADYYYWRPQFASQRHRASTHMVLAEVGSLSMEFTRLAQLTKKDKYYDAIARITDNLAEFQDKTRLPGMWPTHLDISGCARFTTDPTIQKPLEPPSKSSDESGGGAKLEELTSDEKLSPEGNRYIPLQLPDPIILTNGDPSGDKKLSPEGNRYIPLQLPDPIVLKNGDISDDDGPIGEANLHEKRPSKTIGKHTRQLDDSQEVSTEDELLAVPGCVSQGFASSSDYGMEIFTLGGMSDSLYEYLPKQYLLLGGLVGRYRTMYEKSMNVVKKHLIFRPMLPNNDDILFSGTYLVPADKDEYNTASLLGENTHLTCFAGGMFAMGSKLFDRAEDLEIARKLAAGCVWSYGMTASGIMPESFEVKPCKDAKDCHWNETLYMEMLDPYEEYRFKSYQDQMEAYESQLAVASSWYQAQQATMTPSPHAPDEPVSKLPGLPALSKRDVGFQNAQNLQDAPTKVLGSQDHVPVSLPSLTSAALPGLYSPSPPMNHSEFIRNRVSEERLPKGITRIGARNYLLRPEAIESVWYMYRITGDAHWREAGWRMFLAIDKHTSTAHGNSAMADVTSANSRLTDEMESRWLSETLKYCYLLFEEESAISLDEWVLNTKAHPFRRP